MSEADTVFVVYESVAQSHDTDRTDLANESVLTFPVIDVCDTENAAAVRANNSGLQYAEAPAAWF